MSIQSTSSSFVGARDYTTVWFQLDEGFLLSWFRWKTFLLGILAGVYLAFAGALSYTVAGEVNDVSLFQIPHLERAPLTLYLHCECAATSRYREGEQQSMHAFLAVANLKVVFALVLKPASPST